MYKKKGSLFVTFMLANLKKFHVNYDVNRILYSAT